MTPGRSPSRPDPARRLSFEKCSFSSSSTLRRRVTSRPHALWRYAARASGVVISRASKKISRSVTMQNHLGRSGYGLPSLTRRYFRGDRATGSENIFSDERQQLGSGLGIAFLNGFEDLGDLAHGTHCRNNPSRSRNRIVAREWLTRRRCICL